MGSKAKLLSFWDDIRSNFWFIPTVFAVITSGFSELTLWLDRSQISNTILDSSFLYTGSAEGARSILSTIASSMIGTAGVVFSITMLTLALASKQFGPRLLRNFIRDRGNQVVLAIFISAFLYCLLILRKLHGEDSETSRFIPQISMLTAVAFAIAGIAVLIYYIHHIASSIQTSTVLEKLSRELNKNLKTLYPSQIGKSQTGADQKSNFQSQIRMRRQSESLRISSGSEGYIRRFDEDLLVTTAKKFDLLINCRTRPGDFISCKTPIFEVWPKHNVTDEACKMLKHCFQHGDQRTQEQDARFTIEQIVGIALMALSPSVNDPFTAIQCLHRLGSALSFIAGRDIPSGYRTDEDGKLRVITSVYNFENLVSMCLDQIRLHSKGQLRVYEVILETLHDVSLHTNRADDNELLLHHGILVQEFATKEAQTIHDKKGIEKRFRELATLAHESPRQRIREIDH